MTNCTICPRLVNSRHKICWGEIHSTYPTARTQVMVITDKPDIEEDKEGRPLLGSAGQEARHHLNINGISSRGIWVDNLVKCAPPFQIPVHQSEIDACTSRHLVERILTMKPKWIIPMGKLATQWLIGPCDMMMVHGIPRTIDFHGLSVVVIPTFHPAAGINSPENMLLFQCDLRNAGDVIRGLISPHPPVDEYEGREQYGESVASLLFNPKVVAIDTEWARRVPFCLSYSTHAGQSDVIKAGHTDHLDVLNSVVSKPDVTTIIHNALYDLPVLEKMGVFPARTADTMVMAYLLQNEPQGLKPLAFRHCGMKMNAYEDMVAMPTYLFALEYINFVAGMTWPDPELVMEWKDGAPHVRKPQNIAKKAARILKALGNADSEGPAAKWKAVDEGKEIVEAMIGPLQEGELCDIPWPDARQYSARDADATIRIYPILWERIVALGLEDTFWRDMRMLPMVVDMMASGVPINPEAFAELSVYFQEQLHNIQRKMQNQVGHFFNNKLVNPASYPQMSELIYDHLKLHEDGGRHKGKKKKGKMDSTANEVLSRYLHLHPVVQDILDWRGYQKLKTTYADPIPILAKADGRIHTTFRITRTTTGRLSSAKPNLMAQPTKSEDGRKIRDCYEAGEGMTFVSIDFSGIEMRTVANDAQDEAMLNVFWTGGDIHSITASAIFKIPLAMVDEKKHRYPAKRVGFGILYMMTAEGLLRELSAMPGSTWTLNDCKAMIKGWFELYWGIAAFMKRNGEFARQHGYVKDMWGRIRYIPGIRSTNKWVRLEAERQAGNAPIQMGAQGVIKEAMAQLITPLKDYRQMGIIRPLLQVHDEILFEMEEWMVPIVVPELQTIMANAAQERFVVPLLTDAEVGKRWGSMKGFHV